MLYSGLVIASTLLGGAGLANRDIEPYDVKFYFRVGETPDAIKRHNERQAVNNNDYMSVDKLQCGMTTRAGYSMSDTVTFKKAERKLFPNKGTQGNKYILQISKLPGQGTVEAEGTWSPDTDH